MSLQFIFGSSGSGKSHELYKDVINASAQSPGTQFLVIVPEQFTMQTQKELVHLHPDRGILNIDVLSFQRLSHRIFEEVGEDKRTVLEDMGKTLLLRRVAVKYRDELKVLGTNLGKKGYLAQVKSLISEFAQYDIDEEKMETMLQASKDRKQLYYKLQDLQTLYRGFRMELQEKYITAEETLDALCQVAERSRILKDSVIVLDGFTGFTPIQNKVLKRLMILAKKVYVSVTIDARADCYHIYHEHELFQLSKKTIQSVSALAVEAGCEILEPIILKEETPVRFKDAPALAFLEKEMFRGRKKEVFTADLKDQISVHYAQNPMEEIRFVGRKIRSLIQDGYRYADMAIIVGNVEAYESYLPAILKEYEVPVFMDQTRQVFTNPLIEFIRAALELSEKNYGRESVFRYLRTGICGLEASEIDALENYCLAAGIKGKKNWKEPFTKMASDYTEEEFSHLNDLRERFFVPMERFQAGMRGNTKVKDKVICLYELISFYDIQRQLSQYEESFTAEGAMDLAKEYSQIYGLVLELFDKMVELLGDEEISLSEFSDLCETGFEEMKIGIIPPSADLIPVGNIERTRLKDIKVLFFMGLNDGYVPTTMTFGGLISDMEREELKKSKVNLAPTAREESYIQRFYLYLNLTKPSEKLYLSYSKSGSDGSTLRPSYLIHTLETMFEKLAVIDEDKCRLATDLAVTPMSGIHCLVAGMQKIRQNEPEETWIELYNWYRRQPQYIQLTEKLLDAVFLSFTEEGIGKQAARELYGEILVNSVSRLERFVGCAFAHFLEYGLKLEERKEYAFNAADFGQIIHRIVEVFSRKVEERGYNWKTIREEERDRLMDECVDEVTADFGAFILHSSHRSEYMITRIRRIMRRTAWALQRQILAGTFIPSDMEVAFSQAGNLESINIALSEEEKMRLKGRIDRIDVCEKEHQVYVKVIDYKSGNKDFDLVALYHGLQLQLVVYLSAATELKKKSYPDKEIIPAGIFYYHVDDPMLDDKEELTPEEINEKILEELRLRGVVNSDPEVFFEMDTQMNKKSKVIPVTLNKNGEPSKTSKIISTDQFRLLSAYAVDKMKKIGKDIMNGDIAAVPYERKNMSGCDYCIYKEICRLDPNIPGTHTKRLREYSKEQIWDRMEIVLDGNTVDERTE